MAFTLRARTWLNRDEVLARVRRASVPRVVRCAALVEGEAKRLLSRGRGKARTPVTLPDGRTIMMYPVRGPGDTRPPMLISGNLRSAIAYARTETGTVVVGPQRVGWYGRVHEFGAEITVTPRMAGYLRVAFGWNVKPGKKIVIPRRPFMRPALDRCRAQFAAQFRDLPIGGTV